MVYEVLDSFILATILPALVSRQDIKVKGAVSDYFYYHSKTLIYLLSKVFGYKTIKIYADEIIHTNFNPTVVATGFSGGVDSFATYINHIGDGCLEEFKIDTLALFIIGSYGNEYNQSFRDFSKDIKRAEEFAECVGMPLVVIDSNIGELYSHPDIFNYSLRSTICLSAGILTLQKLWKTYFLSSTTTIDDMRLNKWDQYYYENSITQLLSNNNTDIIIAETDIDRVQKTKLIAENELAQKYLYVCAADILNAKTGMNYRKDRKPNCGACVKCTRTEITLDYLGVLDKFKERFDLEQYYRLKPSLECEAYLDKDHWQREIFSLMQKTGFRPTFYMRVKKIIFTFSKVGEVLRKIRKRMFS